MKTALDVEHLLNPNSLGQEIGYKWNEWRNLRQTWIEEKKELRNYIFATDTTTTSNKKLPWSNSTTTPKLTQIYDNLKANYTAALFPNSKWLRFEPSENNPDLKRKTEVIESYMVNKLRQSKFPSEIDKLLDDYILYGNCFATVEYAAEYNEVEGEMIAGYVGPRVVRISPYDIVFNPTASSFENTPKIVRSIVSLGGLKKHMENLGQNEVYQKIYDNRRHVLKSDSTEKADAFVADGFSNITHYYGSGYVELLTFYGDIFDPERGEFKYNRKITVVDRSYIVEDVEIPSWLGHAPIFHAGWRARPDNLYHMGPLDNLVGMQYRLDHLENLRADVFDQIALPMLKIRGDVEAFEYEPGGRIFMGEDGDVGPLVPDATALQADLQINLLSEKMEELAGAPRQAMGIRTPGEKTAFEVQTLQNSASRIFQHKASQFEREFIEPLLNAMIESARRNMDTYDVITTLDDATGATFFREITREDIVAKGAIVPKGARHFAERAQRVQNINQLLMARQDPTIGTHISGKEAARLLTQEIGEPSLYGENITVYEQMETQEALQEAQVDMEERSIIAEEEGL